VEKVEIVSGAPTAFKLVFRNFIMELEASNPLEAAMWMNAVKEQLSKWKETNIADETLSNEADLLSDDDSSMVRSESCTPTVPPGPPTDDITVTYEDIQQPQQPESTLRRKPVV
jgi:hypothetical protein